MTRHLPAGPDGYGRLRLPDDTELALLSQGQGPLLLMIHGSLCDARYWQPQMPALSARRLACAPSLRHYHPLPAGGALDWRRDVRDMLHLLDTLSPDAPVDVMGHSRGGAIAYRLALAAPGRVRRLVLAEPGGEFGPAGQADAQGQAQFDQWKALLRERLARGETEAAVAEFVDAVSRPGTWRMSPAPFRAMALDNAQTLPGQLADPLPRYSAQEAASLALPVLLVKGQRSRARFRQTVDALAQALPQARTVEIAGASHGMNLAHPRAFNAAVADFLQ
ncbi:alpha/beta hydrolase [Orrella sp. JC864]|uniref:alpha/beta fold hydrolase n=1 Tax=Orrella sp. JC864 TaxID=3120298 RepID=UPI0012BD6BFE